MHRCAIAILFLLVVEVTQQQRANEFAALKIRAKGRKEGNKTNVSVWAVGKCCTGNICVVGLHQPTNVEVHRTA